MKKMYIFPEMNTENLMSVDVITASGQGGGVVPDPEREVDNAYLDLFV